MEALAKIPAPLAVRCVDLANCGWGIRPSVRMFEEIRLKQDRCARCDGPMETVTAEELLGRLPHKQIEAS